ncbi:catalase (peroxidase I) [Streptacidiphilus sp. MAP5-52]
MRRRSVARDSGGSGCSCAAVFWLNGAMDIDGGAQRAGAALPVLEPFWPSRQQFHFDQTCCRCTGAQA